MIGIVTVLFNSAPVLDDFFKSLDNQTYKDFILYVVDNKSGDNSMAKAQEMAASVEFKTVFLPQSENWGVAKGNNIGIKEALSDGCSYVLLSNNDIVLESQTIELLMKGHQENKASLSVPKIYFWSTSKIIWAAGGYWHLIDGTSRHYGYKEKDDSIFGINKQIHYAPTCFMLINACVFDKIGYMDENYFVYYDDADFVWRSTMKNDEKLYYIANSIIWHKESFSTGGAMSDFMLYYMNRNKIYFSFKHLSKFQRAIMYTYLFIHYCFRVPFVLNKSQRDVYRKGLIEGFNMAKKLVVK